MGNAIYDAIPPDVAEFIAEQPMFFVATSPLSPDGRVNLSPKGADSFRVLSPNLVCYLDITGSGNETSAHLTENGRITFMFCSFAKAPSIVRLYGIGTTILRDSPDWSELRGHFDEYPAVRQIILAEITRVQTSCGFGVPLMDYKGQREAMPRWAETLSDTKLVEYWEKKNVRSIDGLPAALARRTRR